MIATIGKVGQRTEVINVFAFLCIRRTCVKVVRIRDDFLSDDISNEYPMMLYQ
jgi:hypothetical protein